MNNAVVHRSIQNAEWDNSWHRQCNDTLAGPIISCHKSDSAHLLCNASCFLQNADCLLRLPTCPGKDSKMSATTEVQQPPLPSFLGDQTKKTTDASHHVLLNRMHRLSAAPLLDV